MNKITKEDLVKHILENDLVLYSKSIFLKDRRGSKIEAELNLNLNNNNSLSIIADHKEIFYCEMEDRINKKIFHVTGDIYLDNNIITLEKIVDLENQIIDKIVCVAVKRNRETVEKWDGYILSLKRKMIDRTVDILTVYTKTIPTVDYIRNFIKLSRIPILDQSKYLDDQYLENIINRLKETIDLDLNDPDNGVDLSIYEDSSLTQTEKLGIYSLSIPGMFISLSKNILIHS